MTESGQNKINFLQYLNTVILTIITIVAVLILSSISKIRDAQDEMKVDQSEMAKELLRIKTVQDINTASIGNLDARVKTLELNYLDYIKTWVDQNYVRKSQK